MAGYRHHIRQEVWIPVARSIHLAAGCYEGVILNIMARFPCIETHSKHC
jgi:hypothetical protein